MIEKTNVIMTNDFYATMAIRGTWSVRELQRQIDTN